MSKVMPCAHLGRRTGVWTIQGIPHVEHQCNAGQGHGRCYPGGHPTAQSCQGCRLYSVRLARVDVVITSHNYGHFLAECLQSVLAQPESVIGSIVVVDDASSDNPRQIVESLNSDRVQFMRVNRRDPHKARGDGFNVTNSPLVHFLDADNTLQPGYLQAAAGLFATNHKLAIAYTDLEEFGDASGLRRLGPDGQTRAEQLAALERMNFIDTGSVWRREALDQVNAFRGSPRVAEDWWMARQIVRSGQWEIAKNPVPLNYRRHGSQRINHRDYSDYFACASIGLETVTICTTFSRRVAADPSLWQRRRDWLNQQAWPKSQIRIVVANTSHAPAPAWLLDGLTGFSGVSIYDHPVGASGLEDVCRFDARVEERVQTAVAAIYNRMLREVAGEFVLVLEDDVFPDRLDLIDRLLHGFDRNTVAVSAAYQQRYHPFAWTAFVDESERPKLIGKKGTGIQQIAGCGFGCVMMRRSQVLAEVIAGNTPISRYYDTDLWRHVTGRWLTVKLDWECVCEHVGPRVEAGDGASPLVRRVETAIQYADRLQSRLSTAALAVEGMSSPKVRHLLSNLSAKRYLEVGSWKGSTAIAATEGQLTRAICVDNWSGFGGPRDAFLRNTAGLPITLIDADASTVDLDSVPAQCDVLFYDGDHDPLATTHTIARLMDRLATEAVVIVDDTNFEGVAEAGRAGVRGAGFAIIKEWLLPAARNGDTEQWWNGLLVMVVRKLAPALVQLAEPVGSRLADVLRECGIRPPCHRCREWIDQMNQWGIAGCQQPDNRQAILDRLHEASRDATWGDWLRVARRGYLSTDALLDEALRRSKAAEEAA